MKKLILTSAIVLTSLVSIALPKYPAFIEGKKYQVGDTVRFENHICVITKTLVTKLGKVTVFEHYTLKQVK